MADALAQQYTARRISARQQQLGELAQACLRASEADQTEIRLSETDTALTRFAGSQIHQNTLEQAAALTVAVRLGRQEGRASTNRLDAEGFSTALAAALAAARVSPANPGLADLPAGPQHYPLQVDFHEATAACSPEERARLAITAFKASDDPAFTASGALATLAQTVLVANSRGMHAVYSTTLARLSVLWTGPDSTGYAERSSRDIAAFDVGEAAVQALAVARRSANPRRDVMAGRYPVVLGPACSATLLGFLAGLAFAGKRYAEGSGALSGKLGTAVCGEDVTILDDPLDPRLLAAPCDASGLPKQRLGLIEHGTARGVAHDADSARRAGMADTAHANDARDPLPGSLVLLPGAHAPEQLIRGIERGLYVSRFHYTNTVDPVQTLITGMTRDGTFLIERGALAGAVTNFRFTQAILPALQEVQGIGAEQVLLGSPAGGHCLVPEALALGEFNFSGKSDH